MSAHAAATFTGPRARLSRQDARRLMGFGLAASAVIIGMAVLGDSPGLLVAGAVGAAVLGALLAPQAVFALFLFAGATKAAPWLGTIPFDLTLVTAAGVLTAMLARAVSPRYGIPPFPPAALFAAGLVALILLGAMWSSSPDLALERALRFETLTMITFAAPLVLIRTRSELMRLAALMVALSLLIAITAVETGHPSEPVVAAGGTGIQLSLFTSLGLFAAVAYLMVVTPSWRKVIWLIPVAWVFVPTILAAGSRGVLVGGALGLLIVGAHFIARARHKLLPVGVIAVTVVVILISAPGLVGPAGKKYATLFSGKTEELGDRNTLLRQGWEIALAHPMGLGVASFHGETGSIYPHNFVLEALDEEGIIGLALLLGLIVAAWRATRRAPEGPTSPEATLAASLLVLLVAEALFSETFTQLRVLWFAFGLALAVPRIRTTE
jgi:O-antigen ligase